MYCKECGAKNSPEVGTCLKCWTELTDPTSQKTFSLQGHDSSPEESKYVGFGGWLIVLVVVHSLSLFYLLLLLMRSLIALPFLLLGYPIVPVPPLIATVLLAIALLPLTVIFLKFLFEGNPKVYPVFVLVALTTMTLIVNAALQIPYIPGSIFDMGYIQIIVFAIWAAAWLAYFSKSQRVRNHFGDNFHISDIASMLARPTTPNSSEITANSESHENLTSQSQNNQVPPLAHSTFTQSSTSVKKQRSTVEKILIRCLVAIMLTMLFLCGFLGGLFFEGFLF